MGDGMAFLDEIFGSQEKSGTPRTIIGGNNDPLMIQAALDGFGQSLTVNPTSYSSVIRPVLAAMKRAINQDIQSQRQKTAASKFDAILLAKGASRLI